MTKLMPRSRRGREGEVSQAGFRFRVSADYRRKGEGRRVTFYVATRAAYVLIEAADESQSRALAESALHDLLGCDVPVQTARPATSEM
jgi:hypothetical protein